MSKPDDLMRGLELGKLFAAGRAEEEITRLKSENAKLRELVLARFACDSDACESCACCQLSGSKPFRCVEVARELCVEVDG